MEYQDDITQIKGIGDKMAKLFNKLSVFNVSDLIELYPREYDRYEKIVPIENLTVGKVATIEGFINNIPMIKTIKKLNIINVMFWLWYIEKIQPCTNVVGKRTKYF